ncbi:hypothetical protein DSCO28_63470 [Desulfosarcina ovata subsp. sediminis]|uniref:Uncharacterized protein n=1 Tax=Desulfosarcina ovata subsp. sediminis TaxID=885957 RepID=A0A5K8A061_9BACT|nr:hypothetical protein [Desulfosarcina ovata]BBO85781.1 hypothetical protein DSCO28_63470 [Desulfosarcina ovata subsp. sediminis]
MLNCFFNNFDSAKEYTHSQIQKIIESRRNVLCFYAIETGFKRCALALNFDEYNQKDGAVPLHILLDKEVWALSLTQGKELQDQYNSSLIGKNIIVIYTAQGCSGWFSLKFDLGKYTAATSK